MSRTLVPVAYLDHSGKLLDITLVSDVVNKNHMPNDGRTVLVISNRFGLGIVNVTIYTQSLIDGDLPVPNRVTTIGPGQVKAFGTFPQEIYNDANGDLLFDVDTVCPLIAVSIG